MEEIKKREINVDTVEQAVWWFISRGIYHPTKKQVAALLLLGKVTDR